LSPEEIAARMRAFAGAPSAATPDVTATAQPAAENTSTRAPSRADT
jgi:hypothetical protein